jgi:hypothetical protein
MPMDIYLPLIVGPFGAPVLLWQGGGCYSSWCETGWYASPAVADLNGDGKPEVVGATYSAVALDAANGSLIWRQKQPGTRAWPGVVTADLDGDGKTEVVVAHGDGVVDVLNPDGSVRWSKQPTPGNELRSLAAADLNQDGKLEVLVASTRSSNQWMVYQADGSPYPGAWPQLNGSVGYAAGAFNENIAVADLDHDGRGEIIGPSDVHYITAYQDDGTQILANARYTHNGSRLVWSQVNVNVDEKGDLRGYTDCATERRPNFADSAPAIADLDGDGNLEVIVVGNVYNCATDPYTDLYQMPFIFNADRSRWHTAAYDWTAIPTPDSKAAPRSEDYNRIETALPNPVPVDLDGDGKKEILYASYDGRLHAYWLDKTEHGSWPFAVTQPGDSYLQFASEPAVADLNNDGKAEVIFTTWTEKGSKRVGSLFILDYQGNLLQRVNLPAGWGTSENGALPAPMLARLGPNSDLTAFINTIHSGLVAYDLPATAGARILWGTGRGSYLRDGTAH